VRRRLRRRAAGAALLAALAAAPSAHAEHEWTKVLSVEAPVEEIGGIACLGTRSDGTIDLLAVCDEGRYDPPTRRLTGALFRLRVETPAEAPPSCVATAIDLDVGDHFARLDPAWVAAGESPVDLEALSPLPGRPGHWLLAGERNPEDRTDDGANRLYVVGWDGRDASPARLLAYLRLPDLPDDLSNDRFEGVVALPRDDPGSWRVHLFKERTAFAARRLGHVSGVLREAQGTWSFEPQRAPGGAGLRVRFLAEASGVVTTQSDACAGPAGEVWVLDRWRRVVHRAAPRPDGTLALAGGFDLFRHLREVVGEFVAAEPAAPGHPDRHGFGRHEALALDGLGRLWLAADRGDGRPSALTLLAPR
jgi:hypothetical protein